MTAASSSAAGIGLSISLRISLWFTNKRAGNSILLTRGWKPQPAAGCNESVEQEILLLLLGSVPGKEQEVVPQG